MTDVLLLIGRIIVGVYFIFSASNHFMHRKMMAGYAGSKGVPSPLLAVLGTGLLLLLGGLSFLLGIYPRVGAVLLLLFFGPVTFMMHQFWTVSDPQARMGEQINFGKNLALAGLILMTFAIPLPWGLSLG